MKTYRVEGGTFQLGAGELAALSDAQINPRARNLDIVKRHDGGAVVRPKVVLQFKSGEIIGLAAEPPKSMAAFLVEVDTAPAAKSAEHTEIKPAAKKTRRPKKAEVMAQIADAIAQLDPANEEHFGRDGSPHVKALDDLLGYNITAAERDEVWAKLKKPA